MHINYSYKHVPTIRRFSDCDDFVRCLMGPFGSGKSAGSVIEIIRRAHAQEPGSDGVRRTRWAVIRNTYPQLKDTTIRTVHDWLPPSTFGEWKSQEHTYIIRAFKDVEVEILFRALDRPDQVANLLSLELTGAWVNEAREVPKAIIDGLTGRVGRFPSKRDGVGCTWSGIWMDTNPPDDDSWMYQQFEVEKPEGWSIFKQPSGLAKDAENIPNLPESYYRRQMSGKDPEWIKVYIEGKYGSVFDGKPIFPEFNDSIHVSETPLQIYRGLPIFLGWDFGLTPACIIGQVSPRGQLRLLDELVSEDMGIRQFVTNVVKPKLAERYSGMKIHSCGDPAGAQRAQTDEKTCMDELRNAGIPTLPARTNVFSARREAVAGFLNRMVDGQPGLVLDPQTVQMTRKGLNGGYRYRRIQVAGDARYTDKPDKNRYSHIADALQYLALSVETPEVTLNLGGNFDVPVINYNPATVSGY